MSDPTPSDADSSLLALMRWTGADGGERQALWRGSQGAPRRLVGADDRMPADAAFRLAAQGTALVWEGDYQNARQLMQALARRVERRARQRSGAALDLTQAFHLQRQAQAQRARLLGSVVLPFGVAYALGLRRAPDVRAACEQAWGPAPAPALIPLRDVLGAIGAYEWRRQGVPVAPLNARIHPHYGVFAPTRGEYLDLVARAPLPPGTGLAFDIGTGTGVLAAILARRGVPRVIATDTQPAALASARENLERLGLQDRVELRQTDLFPAGRANLIVCNPPWLPGKPASRLEEAIYDPDSRMLRGFLQGLAAHLAPQGEGWLVMSDLAERLGLRPPQALSGWIAEAGLAVRARLDTRPSHRRAADRDDPLHAARSAEVTTLWRLAAAGQP